MTLLIILFFSIRPPLSSKGGTFPIKVQWRTEVILPLKLDFKSLTNALVHFAVPFCVTDVAIRVL